MALGDDYASCIKKVHLAREIIELKSEAEVNFNARIWQEIRPHVWFAGALSMDALLIYAVLDQTSDRERASRRDLRADVPPGFRVWLDPRSHWSWSNG